MLSEEFKERLKAANPIEEVMGAYVTLKRMGRDYICLCPFHNEKTPSCHVRPDQEYFHCFGCGAGGDVVTFVMRYMNLEYIDAMKWLADRAGLEMPEDSDYKKKTGLSRERAIKMNKDAARFFFDKLRSPEGKICLDYLVNKRGLTIDTIKKYGMGYAPNSWNELKNHMMSLGYKENELEFKKMERESAEKAIKGRNSLEIEKEYTEQSRINLQKEIEKTKQLQIESDNIKRKHAESYIKFLNS